ncbi:cell division protein FtsQ/DivIB [Guggenheimella bovis]
MKRLFYGVLLLLAIALIAWVVIYSDVFTIKTIHVYSEVLDEKDILEMGDVKIGDHLLRVDLKKLHEKLLKNPKVETVTTNTILPSTLEITVTERKPFVILETKVGPLTLDQTGRVIAVNEKLSLVHIKGAPITEYTLGGYVVTENEYLLRKSLDLTSLIYQTDLKDIVIEFKKDQIYLFLNPDYRVNFGTCSDIERQFSNFMALYKENALGGTDKGFIDVRDPDNMIFKPFE